MKRLGCVILLAACLGGVYRAWSATPDGTGGGSTDVAPIHLVFALHTTLSSGTVVICKARLDAQNLRPELARVSAGRAMIDGSSTACAIELPAYSFNDRRLGSAVLLYAIEVERQPGNLSIPLARGSLPPIPAIPASSAVFDINLVPAQ
jgi:hypothetical protein